MTPTANQCFSQCTVDCTTDCGHCKGRPVEALREALRRAQSTPDPDVLTHRLGDRDSDARFVDGYQYAVEFADGNCVAYGDQSWVASGQALQETNGKRIVRRAIGTYVGPWEVVKP